MHGTRTLGMLLRCLSNIDEEVLASACDALFCLLNRSPPSRLLFLRRRGIAELNECLSWYKVPPALFEDTAPSARLVPPRGLRLLRRTPGAA